MVGEDDGEGSFAAVRDGFVCGPPKRQTSSPSSASFQTLSASEVAPPALDDDALRAIVARHFRIYDEKSEKADGQTVARLYYLMFQADAFDALYDKARAEILAADPELLVFMRHDGGEDILFVTKRPSGGPVRTRANTVLFILTLITTALAGAVYWQGYRDANADFSWAQIFAPETLFWGALTFALPLMLILTVHEGAHFITARRHGLRATLPYFIPVPPILAPFGTFGAVINLREPLPDRKVLFDVGASGPLAGFVVAVPLLVLGAFLTAHMAVEVPDIDSPILGDGDFAATFGDPGEAALVWQGAVATGGAAFYELTATTEDWSFTAEATVHTPGAVRTDSQTYVLQNGTVHLGVLEIPANATAAYVNITWDDHLVSFGNPLLITAMENFWEDPGYLTHPTFFAAWVGLLITGINLLPIGQLDGGHVGRAVLGDKARFAGLASLAFLMFLAFQFSSWLLMALLLLLFGVEHPPPLNDRTKLDGKRKVVAVVVLAVLVLTFVPVPLQF